MPVSCSFHIHHKLWLASLPLSGVDFSFRILSFELRRIFSVNPKSHKEFKAPIVIEEGKQEHEISKPGEQAYLGSQARCCVTVIEKNLVEVQDFGKWRFRNWAKRCRTQKERYVSALYFYSRRNGKTRWPSSCQWSAPSSIAKEKKSRWKKIEIFLLSLVFVWEILCIH